MLRSKSVKINCQLKGFQCIKCHHVFPVDDYIKGCPVCYKDCQPSSVKAIYTGSSQHFLPFKVHLTMGEGNTPLIPIKANNHNLYLKNEGLNPTGSHKDRMNSFVVSKALYNDAIGVVIASSGNAGISLASYAAFARLKCVVIATKNLNKRLASLIKETGSSLLLTDTSLERWEIMQEYVKKGYYPATNFVNPPVGSNPFGIQAFKKIAYEINRDLGNEEATTILVPTSRADLLWGIWEGFNDEKKLNNLKNLPRMIAVEPFPRLSQVLEGTDYTKTFDGKTNLLSIAGNTVTYQGLKAVSDSRGCAVVTTSHAAHRAKADLSKIGIHLEASSAAGISAFELLNESGYFTKGENIIVIGTSNSFLEV